MASIKFDKMVKRSPRLGDSQYFLGEDTHNMLESSVRVMAQEKAAAEAAAAAALETEAP